MWLAVQSSLFQEEHQILLRLNCRPDAIGPASGRSEVLFAERRTAASRRTNIHLANLSSLIEGLGRQCYEAWKREAQEVINGINSIINAILYNIDEKLERVFKSKGMDSED